jgi:ketosteroid isomerase-like protein
MAQDNVDVIEGAYEAFGRGDLDAVEEAIDEQAEFVTPESVPWGGTYRGPDGFRDFVGSLLEHFQEFKSVPEKVLGADDDHVVVVVRNSGRTRGGTAFEGRAVWLYQLRNGKIRSAEAFADTADVLEALG